jgi:hypothetical protein
MVDTETLRLTLWIVAGLLMLAAVVGVGLAVLFGKPIGVPEKKAEPMRVTAAPAAVRVAEAPVEPVSEEVLAARKAAYRRGFAVLVGLAVLTAAEFGVATLLEGAIALLFVFILAKAGLILQYYMHLHRVWSEEEAH